MHENALYSLKLSLSGKNMHIQELTLPEERRRLLLEFLARDGKIVAAEISRRLDVSEDTVRRDLNELAASGQLRRVHGGALPALPLTPAAIPFARRQDEAEAARPAFAAALAAFIRPGDTVLLDGGTTMLATAQALPRDLRATIITPNLPAALALLDHPNIDLILLGGRVDKAEQITSGITTWETIASLSVDLCLLGVCAIDAEAGLMGMSQDDARLKARMVQSANRVVTAASARKLGTRASFRIGPVNLLTSLVTEAGTPAPKLAPYRQAGINLQLV
jgi:DeoR/GlpR family transcriptional regulator of sugar metabolism